jgi:hypothetical protein
VELDASLFDSGVAADVLATWVSVLKTTDLVTQDTIAEESMDVAVYFGSQR